MQKKWFKFNVRRTLAGFALGSLLIVMACSGSLNSGEQQSLQAFKVWVATYQAADSSTEKAALERIGANLAQERRVALKKMIQLDPAGALSQALSLKERVGLPASVTGYLEEYVEGRGKLLIAHSTPLNPTDEEIKEFHVYVQDRVYRAFPARSENIHSGKIRAIKGIALDGVMALESSQAVTAASSRTEGPKSLLLIRVDFSDVQGENVSEADARSVLSTVGNFYVSNSYGKTSFSSVTVTPVIRLPQDSAYYADDKAGQLLRDSRDAARAAGYETNDFDLDMVSFKSIGFGWWGLGYVNGKGSWVQGSFKFLVAAHELGHNYGLLHASFMDGGENVLGDSYDEYGDAFDVMGGGGTQNHFSVPYKHRLNWLTDQNITNVEQSGTYRIYAHDHGQIGGNSALRVAHNGREYWLSHRTLINNDALRSGALIHLFENGNKSVLLDMTPNSRDGYDDRLDSALTLGASYEDSTAGLKFTVLNQSDSSDWSHNNWVEVKVEILAGGLFSGLAYSYYEGSWSALPDFNELTPIKTGISANLDLSARNQNENFGFKYEGNIVIPEDGTYTFYLSSDDGSRLLINEQVIIDNDGLHGRREKSGELTLTAGEHKIEITFFERGGAEILELDWQGPGFNREPVPDSAFSQPLPANPGLDFSYYEGTWSQLPDFGALAPIKTGIAANLDLSARNQNDYFGFNFTGFLIAPVAGSYNFYLRSDDGSKLIIDGQTVIDHDGLHGSTELNGSLELTAGLHTIEVPFFERNGGESLSLNWQPPGAPKQSVPDRAFSREPGSAVSRPGLNFSYYEGSWSLLPDFSSMTPVKSGVTLNLDLSPREQNDDFGFVYTGLVNIPENGTYTFYLSSDDGSRLLINNLLIIDNDGIHPVRQSTGELELTSGEHKIEVMFFERAGGELLELDWQGPGLSRTPVPDSAFSH